VKNGVRIGRRFPTVALYIVLYRWFDLVALLTVFVLVSLMRGEMLLTKLIELLSHTACAHGLKEEAKWAQRSGTVVCLPCVFYVYQYRTICTLSVYSLSLVKGRSESMFEQKVCDAAGSLAKLVLSTATWKSTYVTYYLKCV
jgi:hypothetical protein